jgi:hypothetical protein
MTTLQFYTGFTLVDITATGVTRNNGDILARNQQRNWETAIQAVSLRAQPVILNEPVNNIFELDADSGFGEMYAGEHRVWVWSFAIEHADVYLKDNDSLALLHEDFNQVPVITGLEETARFMLPIFYCHGAIKNTYFKPGHFDLNTI